MGDASQAKRFSESNDSLAHSPLDNDLEVDIEEAFSNERITVIYSHDPNVAVSQGIDPQAVICSTFEQLLLLLEDDRVEAILFDNDINHHERAYITGWSRIFRPTLTAQKLPTEKMAN
jgi:hypothetical protein